ncbi:MAG: urea transporter, partial [Caldilineaceae bacterium]|nr:urea transporter [Caldilineaceae bacterium]
MTEPKAPNSSLLTTLLKGSGQVIFCDHPITGLLFLIGIAWGSRFAGNIWVFLGACVGLLVSTLTAYWLELDEDARNAGLYGYNGILVGAALPTFLHPEWRLWLLLVVASAVSTVLLAA